MQLIFFKHCNSSNSSSFSVLGLRHISWLKPRRKAVSGNKKRLLFSWITKAQPGEGLTLCPWPMWGRLVSHNCYLMDFNHFTLANTMKSFTKFVKCSTSNLNPTILSKKPSYPFTHLACLIAYWFIFCPNAFILTAIRWSPEVHDTLRVLRPYTGKWWLDHKASLLRVLHTLSQDHINFCVDNIASALTVNCLSNNN